MLRSAKELKNFVLQAEDGRIGRCKDFLFDYNFWAIRYMVASTGQWLPGRKVLISPISLGKPDWFSQLFPVRMTKKQIEHAPGLDEDAPVSKQYEEDWTRYFGWGTYWSGPHTWGAHNIPELLYDQEVPDNRSALNKSRDDRLRSVHEVTGYHIQALDHEIGHVENFLIQDKTWIIRYIVVDTRNWLPGKKVLVAPTCIISVDWAERMVNIDLNREQVENSPEYKPPSLVDRVYEERLHQHYGRPKYWEEAFADKPKKL